ncbi:hypothetical protein QQZ08_006261 [Neonectria magnoliae]|uniref:Uncharacterized protein n=1 Tax=Neonectria magnoliae TaxID=2732573 RepID=A0ABR1I0U8_9HYPO
MTYDAKKATKGIDRYPLSYNETASGKRIKFRRAEKRQAPTPVEAVAEIVLRNIPVKAPGNSVDEAIPTGIQEAACCEAGFGNSPDEAGSANVIDKSKGKAVENTWPFPNATGADTTDSVPAGNWTSSAALDLTGHWSSSTTPASVDQAIAAEISDQGEGKTSGASQLWK